MSLLNRDSKIVEFKEKNLKLILRFSILWEVFYNIIIKECGVIFVYGIILVMFLFFDVRINSIYVVLLL